MKRVDRVTLDNSVDGLSPEEHKTIAASRLARIHEIRGRRHEVGQRDKIKQPQSQTFIPGVEPGETTTVRLAGGKYCLGTEATVPFISLSGGGIAQKVISWGEMVEVPDTQMVTIKNESFHRGDIAVNSGWDFATRPPKITVPFGLIDTATGNIITDTSPATPFTIAPEFPLDTRLARRAFIIPTFATDADEINFFIIGEAVKHSFPANQLNNQYVSGAILPAFSAVEPISLGAGGFGTFAPMASGLPMALSDRVTFFSTITDYGVFIPIWFYVLEY